MPWRKPALALGSVLLLSVSPSLQAQSAGVAEQLHLGNEAMRAGHTDEAIGYFQTASKLAPRTAEVFMNLGLAEEQAGHQQLAAAAFGKAVQLKPALPGAELFLGIADYRLNHLDDAVKALSTEVEHNPHSAKALMWLGVTYLAQNKPEEAARVLDRAAIDDPKDVDIMYHRGRAHLLVSKNAYVGIAEANPDHWRVHQVLAEAYQEADRHTDAITEYKLAIKAAPEEPGLHDRLGQELQKNSAYPEADKAYSEELALDPDSITALYHLGRLRVMRENEGKTQDGVDLLRRALAQDPALPPVEYYLGRGTAQLGQTQEAVQHFENAVKLDPEGDTAQQAYYQLAHLYGLTKRPDDAKLALANFSRLKQKADADQKRQFDSRINPNLKIADADAATSQP